MSLARADWLGWRDASPAERQARRQERMVWHRVRPAAERYYRAQLRKIAQQIGHVTSAFRATDPTEVAALVGTLQRYAAILAPWARAVGSRLLYETARRDDLAWRRHARLLGEGIEAELNEANIGGAYQELMERQVDLITSIPREAAQRVHKLATEYLYEGRRAADLTQEIMRQTTVSRSKADLIAVTEVGRAATTFQRVRAEAIGSTHFRWVAVMDYKTRPELGIEHFGELNTLRRGSHRKLHNTVHRWDDPPIAGPNGERALPGCIYNCFPGYTSVSWSGAIRLFRVFYEGPLVRLKVGGEVIDCTPNHPVLTCRGWVAAGQLDTGDYLVCMTGNLGGVAHDDKQEPIATFDDLFASLPADTANRIPSSRFDFHGDITNGDVDQILIDRELRRERDVVIGEEVRQCSLACADRWMGRTAGASVYQIMLESSAGCLDPLEMLLSGLVESDDAIGRVIVSQYNPVPLQCVGDSHRSDSVSGRQGDCAGAIPILSNDFFDREVRSHSECPSILPFAGIDPKCSELDTKNVRVASKFCSRSLDSGSFAYSVRRLQNKSFRNFSGHVYTLETTTGQYSVGSIGLQAKNCRCLAEPILPTSY